MVKILVLMVFIHIVDDYYLQGILSQMKQKRWWKENVSQSIENTQYKNDYMVALLAHSFSWAFMIMLPVAFIYNFELTPVFWFLFVFNFICHAYVDNEKANKFTMNLIEDQSIHLLQIFGTWLALLIIV